jgi:uncharacterized membrane protein YccC
VTATAIAQVNRYFRAVMAVYLGERPYEITSLNVERDRARLANNQMQAALQRLLDDPNTPFSHMEPAITLAYYIPRLGRAITVLLTQLEQFMGSQPHPKVVQFTEEVHQALAQLGESLEQEIVPPSLPPLETTLGDILQHLQTLQKERLEELAQHQDNTPTHRYLNDYNIVATDLQEIVRRVQSLHTALQRFEGAA